LNLPDREARKFGDFLGRKALPVVKARNQRFAHHSQGGTHTPPLSGVRGLPLYIPFGVEYRASQAQEDQGFDDFASSYALLLAKGAYLVIGLSAGTQLSGGVF
jgi:hypothetical protein